MNERRTYLEHPRKLKRYAVATTSKDPKISRADFMRGLAGTAVLSRLGPVAALAAEVHYSPITAVTENGIFLQKWRETGSFTEALGVFESQVVFTPEQRKLLENPNNDTMWLVFGGSGWRSAVELAGALTPTLGRGEKPVGYIDYAVDGVDIESIAKEIAAVQEEFPHITKVRTYGHSLGHHVAAGSMALLRVKLNKQLQWTQALMDSNPIDTDATRLAIPAGLLMKQDPLNSESVLLTAATNERVYHKILRDNSAPPRLLWDQGRVMRDGRYYMELSSILAITDHTEVYFLRTADPEKDVVEDPRISQKEYEKMFHRFRAILLNGANPNHANPIDNLVEYDKQIREHVPA